MKTVAVTQRIDYVHGRNEVRDALDQQLCRWLVRSGFLPIPVPNSLVGNAGEDQFELLDIWLHRIRPDALVLSGGNNIGEYPVRDLTEDHLLSWAEVNEVPVLGVCRGMQMIANWAGSGLVAVDGHTGSSHKLLISGGESGFPKVVNSFHDWAIVECPDKFKVLAHSEDGVIEAIRHQSLKWEGWMWHPERELHPHIKDTERLNRLFAVL